jgi:DNA-binding NarL/FixJ family response regulator
MIRLLVVDNQALFRESLSHLFAAQPDMEVAGQCGAAGDALQQLRENAVDVLVVTGRLGLQFVSDARAQSNAGIVLIAESMEPDVLLASFHSGARAILSRDVSSDTLTRAIRVVASGGAWLNQDVVDLLVSGSAAPEGRVLSEKEQAILKGISEGLTNRGIASALQISEGAVKAALHRMYRRTQTATRAQLMRRMLAGDAGKRE